MSAPAVPAWVAESLRCPVGGHPVTETRSADLGAAFVCSTDSGHAGARWAYRVSDGIPVMLNDQAWVAVDREAD